MIPVNSDTMSNMVAKFQGSAGLQQRAIIGQTGPALVTVLPKYDITTRLRIAHFLAQCAHESAGFRTLEEFASGVAYNGRKDLGNVIKGDGQKFKGRGLIELTGRANYRRVGKALGLPLEDNPPLASVPENALAVSCEFWKEHDLNTWADQDNVIEVTQIVNGGQNGIDSRRTFLAAAKREVIRAEAGMLPTPLDTSHPILHRGMKGPDVGRVQDIIRRLGHTIAIDQDFGPGTEALVIVIQRNADLTADGIVGEETWKLLDELSALRPT